MKNESSTEPEVICVDLDGSLVRLDTLVDAAFAMIRHTPWTIFRLIAWLRLGRLEFKKRVLKAASLNPETLPYNSELLSWLRDKKAQGATLTLATASRIEVARPIAAHLKIFDEVMTSTDFVNLKGEVKANLLRKTYGDKKFSYVGNSVEDIQVWQHSSAAHVCGSDRRLINKAKKVTHLGTVFKAQRGFFTSLFRALRPHQWIKNFLVFLPVVMAHDALGNYQGAIFSFFAFSLVASAVYLVNDMIDVPSDRLHPEKKMRPFASGDLDQRVGVVATPILLGIGFALASAVNFDFLLALIAYLCLTTAYSFGLKKVAIADILLLSTLYTLRILAGGLATSTFVSHWLLMFSMFFFGSLAFMKRVSEVRLKTMSKVAQTSDDKNLYQLAGRGYVLDDMTALAMMGVSSGFMGILIFALYIANVAEGQLYSQPMALWLICPLLQFWLAKAWLVTLRGQMNADPVVYAIKDPVSRVVGIIVGVIWLLAWTT